MNKITAIVGISLLTAVLQSCGTGGEEISLRFKFEPGLKLVYDQTTRRSLTVTEADSVTKQSSATILLQIEQTVRRVLPDTSAEILERDSWDYTQVNEKDSTKLDTVRGSREMVVFVKPNGKVVDIDFTSEMDSSTASYIEDYFDQATPVFPSGELRPGQSWTQETSVFIDSVPTVASTCYIFTGVERQLGYRCAVITYDGNLVIPVKISPQDSTQRQGVDRIRATGTMYFAYQEGCVVMQVENWTVAGQREKLSEGASKSYRVDSQSETRFALKERKLM
ncbi:MAG: hypothetical protein AB1644_00155 [Candidatus Zixiibacteriota bacterium]